MLDLFYHPLYTYGIDKNSRFPRDRYRLTREALENKNSKIKFQEPQLIDVEDIYMAHDRSYVDSFFNGTLTDKEKRKIGLQPWNNEIIDRTRYIMGGSVEAMRSAVRSNGIAANMAGGTHHAHFSFGSGYCIFNDLAICAIRAQKDYENIKNILVIDLDVHQGDGTASIFSDNESVFTFSMHCDANFPLKKASSDLDIPLAKATGDNDYLEILSENLNFLEKINADIVFFQAGVDTHEKDSLGHLNLSKEGLKERNTMVLKFSKKRNLPLVVFMGGGYSNPINYSVDSFVDLFIQCADY